MAKPIRSFDNKGRVISRRIQSKTGGLGYLSALAALARQRAKPSGDKAIRERLIQQGILKPVETPNDES